LYNPWCNSQCRRSGEATALYFLFLGSLAYQAIWLHSTDTQLVEIGNETTINYFTHHTYYLQHIVDTLADDKAWAVALLDHWDHVLFPDVNEPHTIDGSTRNSRLEANEDNEDFFNSAPV
jgi:hypothetical protein